ncbi:cobalt-zinc-cadmium resistance protein CzcD [Hydrogenimonas sp.]|nr:cobalt-zinc-cadmium resistance protein CzcD [Hydrogenimonas sp.]
MGIHRHKVSGDRLFLAIVLNVVITVAQIVGGVISGSLALLSDALHNFSDVTALTISHVARTISARKATSRSTFGYKRAEIIAALFNASVLVGIGIYLIYESVVRFYDPQPVLSSWVIVLGLLGVVVNGGSIWLLEAEAEGSMNIRAAYLHLLGDTLTSAAVVAGGTAMYFWQIYWVDPLVSVLIALYLIYASLSLIRESTGVLMEFAPEHIDIEKIAEEVKRVPDIENIHKIHLWRLNDKDLFLQAHLDFSRNLSLAEVNRRMGEVEKMLKERYGISYVVLQPEYMRKDEKFLIEGESHDNRE